MKKGIVVLLVGLALIVLISPGLVGKLAERNIDESIRAGTVENDDIVVTASAFERGWFTTEGQHRIEFKGGNLSEGVREYFELGPDAPLPVLVINTRVDHGLIPLASMGREDGSLAPGLGDAVSTLYLEMPDGSVVDIPGTIDTSIGLTGNLVSDYELPAGSLSREGVDVVWGDVNIEVAAQSATGRVSIDADVASLDLDDGSGSTRLNGVRLSGEQRPSGYGYALGDARLEIEALGTPDGEALGPLVVYGSGRIEDEQLRLDLDMDFTAEAPGIGETHSIIELRLGEIDPDAFGRFVRKYQAVASEYGENPQQVAALLDAEAQALVAGGLALDVPRFELTLPDGTLESTLELRVDAVDPADFTWTGLLLGTEGSANVRIPEPLMDFVLTMNPQAAAAIGTGFLKKDGDAYVSDLRYAKGLLTVNGVPMSIPLPAP